MDSSRKDVTPSTVYTLIRSSCSRSFFENSQPIQHLAIQQARNPATAVLLSPHRRAGHCRHIKKMPIGFVFANRLNATNGLANPVKTQIRKPARDTLVLSAVSIYMSARVSEAFVLQTWPFREGDAVVSFFTRDYGKLR